MRCELTRPSKPCYVPIVPLFGNWKLRSPITRSNPRNEASTSTSGLVNPEQRLLDAILGQMGRSGIRVTPHRALGVATVFACVNVVSKTIATLPLKLRRRLPDGGKELATDHPLYDLLHSSPNEEMTSADFRLCLQSHLSLRGNCYAQIRRNFGGTPIELLPLHPSKVTPERGLDGVLSYRLIGCGKVTKLPASSILHLRGQSKDGICGLDLVHTMSDVIGLAMALEDNAAYFFANASRPGLVFEYPGQLSAPAANRLKADLEEKTTGTNAHRALLLEEGLKLVTARLSNTDSQFDESRDRQDRSIARVFGVPPSKIGLINAEPRANVEESNISFVTDTIAPTAKIWEQTLNHKLLTADERSELFFEFDLDALLRGNTQARYAAYSLAITNGFMNRDEVREKENLNPVPDGLGKKFLTPKNMGVLGEESTKDPSVPSTPPVPEEEEEVTA